MRYCSAFYLAFSQGFSYNFHNFTKDNKMRQRAMEIERFWSTSLEDNSTYFPSTYSKAFILSSEQLVVCQKLMFQAGLLAYVALHCIEALSGLLVELQSMRRKKVMKIKEWLVVSCLLLVFRFLNLRILLPLIRLN